MRPLTGTLALMTALALAACDSGVMGPTVDELRQVEQGMSRDEIHDLVGKPTKTVEPEAENENEPETDQLREIWVTMEYKLTVDYDNGQAVSAQVESLSPGGDSGGDDSGPDMPTSPDEQREMQGQPGEQPASP